MGFSSKPIAERLDRMGDEAEGIFRLWAKDKGLTVEHFGFEGRDLSYRPGMHPTLRKRPDFLVWSSTVPHTFVDPKGTGGGAVKINREDVEHKAFWQQFHPVWFFVYDSGNGAVALLDLEKLRAWAPDLAVGHFEDGGKRNAYYEVPAERLAWQPAPKLPGLGMWG
jgi:hypothetical protein